jgi:membrane-bound lytic murein transglycosylase D
MEESIPMTTPPQQRPVRRHVLLRACARVLRVPVAAAATALLLACATPQPPTAAAQPLPGTSAPQPPLPPAAPATAAAPQPVALAAAAAPAAALPAAAGADTAGLPPLATTPATEHAAPPTPENAASATPLAEGEEPAKAAGPPSDPLRPEAVVSLEDQAARSDLWQRIRNGFAMPDLDNPLVTSREKWYADRPDYVQRMTERAGRYLFHIVEEVEKRGMPTELALLPFIESAFNPEAMSTARASGMWQFIPSTGRVYDLTQNVFRDDRRDVLASTRAALDYLQKLHGMFGDWHLALAAYNWGEGSVQRAMARNQRSRKPTDYMSLRMPTETRYYVPKLQAVKNIIASPQDFGLELPELQNHPYFVVVPIERDMDAALAAELADLPLDEFKTLNPSLNKPVILAAGTPQLLLPYDNADVFLHNLKNHKGPLATWTAWVVPKTMRPAQAATQLGMSESLLREVNHVPAGMLIRAGSTLLVPRLAHLTQDVPEKLAESARLSLAPDGPATRRVVFRARRGETVRTVARRYGVPAAHVALWNQVSSNAPFARGHRVVVYVKAKAKARPVRKVAAPKRSTRAAARKARGSSSAAVSAKPLRQSAPSRH